MNESRGFASHLERILAELGRIDLLIQEHVARARKICRHDEQFQGLCISEKEVDDLLARAAGLPRWAESSDGLFPPGVLESLESKTLEISRKKSESLAQGVALRLDELARLFQLASFDIDAILICLAPELDLRYERLYAYLQDDVTRKRPSVDLVLNLLSPSFEAKLAARRRFTPDFPLLKHHLLQLFDDPSLHRSPLLSRYLNVDERVANYLLGGDELDARLRPYARRIVPRIQLEGLLLPVDVKRRLVLLARERGANDASAGSGDILTLSEKHRAGLIFHFQGPYGVGKQTTAEALCREMGLGLLIIDGERLLATDHVTFDAAVRLIAREALLQNAALYWDNFDALLADDKRAWREALVRELEYRPGITFLAGDTVWEPADALHDLPFVRIEFSRPTHAERVRLWRMSLGGDTLLGNCVDLGALASKFRFSGGQIRDAAATARNLARWRDPENGVVTMDDLQAACRLQSNRKLATLAQKITPRYSWDDIVLPADRLDQLREVCNCVKYRALVYDEWGFDRKLSLGKGLNVLFAGPSGTGKTMAAEIMAGELGLDLYKIDLSTVVSKYIGETEKNLARIFGEAATSNAILFFDEADALFGRRSEVRDSHDRYANVEISYLLQKMEEYEGIVILATNLRKNMDEAFVRRMHVTVEFPFPSREDRRRIWEQIWPGETPRSPDLDLEFMSQRYEIAGGNIRNIALAAAFQAAADGRIVTMANLVQATRREFQKMGRLCDEAEFTYSHGRS